MTMIEKLWRGCLSSQRMFFLFHRSHLQFFALLALGMLLTNLFVPNTGGCLAGARDVAESI